MYCIYLFYGNQHGGFPLIINIDKVDVTSVDFGAQNGGQVICTYTLVQILQWREETNKD